MFLMETKYVLINIRKRTFEHIEQKKQVQFLNKFHSHHKTIYLSD